MKRGNKTISLLMSVFMLLSCWVWFAPTASAAGSYDVKIEVDVSNHRSTWAYFKNFKGADCGYADVTVEYFGENGEEKTKIIDVIGGTGADVYTFNINGVSYPESVFVDFGYITEVYNYGISVGGLGEIKTTVSIKLPGESSYVEIGESIINSGNIESAGTASFDVTVINVTTTIPVNLVWHSVPLKKIFPSGYCFDEDSYSVANYGTTVSRQHYSTLYEPASSKLLYKELGTNIAKNGVCFGMAYVTAAIFNDFPSMLKIYRFEDGMRFFNLRQVSGDARVRMGNYEINLEDYILFSFLYQFSAENRPLPQSKLIDVLKSYDENQQLGVVIAFQKWKTNEQGKREKDGGHAVLAVGIKESNSVYTIMVDDSNIRNNLRQLTISKDGKWSYGQYNNDNSTIEFYVDTHMPYKVLTTGKQVIADDEYENSSNTIATKNVYIDGVEKLSKDSLLMSINTEDFNINSENYSEVYGVSDGMNEENQETTNMLYWINDRDEVTISGFLEDGIDVELAGDNTILTANVSKDSVVTMTIDEKDIGAKIETEKGKEYKLSFETIITDENYNNVETIATVFGTASGLEISAAQTETGLVVTGISDGTVTLSKNNEVISTQTISDATSDIKIIYDKTGESEEIELEYEQIHNHSDEDENGYCDSCVEIIDKEKTCNCLCHVDDFLKFLYTVISWIMNLFGMETDCRCGVQHF